MADGTATHERRVWLLEHYEPGAPSSLLHERIGAMAEAAMATTTPGAVRLILGAVLPRDEEALCLLEADSSRSIRAVCRRSQFRVDRLTRVEPARLPAMEVHRCARSS
jgi:hypothetical protein